MLPVGPDVRIGTTLASAVQAGAVVAAIGALGLAAHQPWLFPSLAPTAVLQAQSPDKTTARPWNAIVGHGCGLLFGWLSVVTLGAQHAPGVLASGHLTFVRVAAACIATLLTTLSMALLRAKHSPAASTTLLFAEGSYQPTGHDVLLVVAGIALTVAMGEVLKRARAHASRRAERRDTVRYPLSAGSTPLSSVGPRS